jgi:alanyl-tRNA synthetase
MEQMNGAGGHQPGSSAEGKDSSSDVVKYETYSKAIGEIKALKSRLNELQAKEHEREQSLLAEQGKYKEALEGALKSKREIEDALKQKDATYAKTIFQKEVKALASTMGARKEALEDIVKVGDWSSVEIDAEYNINIEQLKNQIASLAKSKPYFFSTDAKKPGDVHFSAGGFKPETKSVKELSQAEIIAKLKELE